MNNSKILSVGLVLFVCNFLCSSEITYLFSGGRFGDNLIAYLHAKWLAYKYNMPLRYKPFPYSDQLVLHRQELAFDDTKQYDKVIELTDETVIDPHAVNCLYVVPYYPECVAELRQFRASINFYYAVDWNDPIFLSYIRYAISPIKSLSLPSLPTDRLCVAVHVRKGGGYDAQPICDGGPLQNGKGTPADMAFPLKFPPDSFYVEQLKKVSTFFNNAPMYVYIFTDDQDPKRLADQYALELGLSNIVFDYRKTNNAHNVNVLEDFFSMLKFDVLIRSESSFSVVASRLVCGQLVLYPLEANYPSNSQWTHGTLKIIQSAVVKTKG